jgi:hypothetical protein
MHRKNMPKDIYFGNAFFSSQDSSVFRLNFEGKKVLKSYFKEKIVKNKNKIQSVLKVYRASLQIKRHTFKIKPGRFICDLFLLFL